MSKSRSIIGRWRITEMDNWDQEAVDLVQPGFIEFDDDGLGSLGFIVVTGELDCRDAERDGEPGVEFSWQGSDEGDDVSGRGWAALNPDGTIVLMRKLFDSRAEGGGSACADVPERLALVGRESMAPSRQELLLVLAKDIGDFQPMFGHRCRPSSLERSMGLSWRLSNGFGAACIRTVETRSYRAVV